MGETKTPSSGVLTTRRNGNYRKGVWDGVSEKALNTEAGHSIADSVLKLFDEVDRNMDSWQDVVDRNGPCSAQRPSTKSSPSLLSRQRLRPMARSRTARMQSRLIRQRVRMFLGRRCYERVGA